MADYAATTTLDTGRAERISRNFGMAMGKCDLTNYNTIGAENTDLTKWFRTIKRVIVDGFSANGYAVRWNTTDKCFHAFYPSKAITPTGTVAAPVFSGGALATHVHDIRIIGGQTVAGTDTVQGAVGDVILGKEEASNAVIAGADQATKGGVVPITGGTPAGTNSAPAFTGGAVAAQAGTEVADNVAVGEFNFVAFGLI